MNYLRVGDMAKEANFVFLAIFSGGRPFFSAVFHGLVPPDMFPGGRPCSLGWQEAQPCTERLLMNCAPCITSLFSGHLACPVPEKGASGTEYPSCTGNACFLHLMPQKMRRVPEEAFLSTARIFRTVGGPLRYRILRMLEKRRALPALNASSDRKEKGMARNMTRNAAASKKITAATPKTQTPSITSLSPQLHTQPPASTVTSPATTATHSANKKHHQYKAPPASTVTPPRLSEKSASQSAIGLLGHSGRGRTNRRGTFRTGSPTGTKKKPRLNVTSLGTSEKRQLPTLPPGGAVPSALVSLTSLFGMGRGGSSPL